MTQTVSAIAVLGPGLTGLALGYRVLNLDATVYSAFTVVDVAETAVLGTYRVANGVIVPDAGGYIVFGTALVDYAEAPVDSNAVTLNATAIASISAILCNVWSCSSRTLTMSLAAIKSMLLGSKLELWRGDTLAQTFTGLGDLTGVTDLWFTVKKQDLNDADTAAEIQISQTGGLLAIAGATATTPANGSITINLPATQGSITVNLTAEEMAKLDIDFTGYWDIQKLTGATVVTITRGNASVLGDVTRRIV